MIKLIDCNRKEEGEEIFISKDNIGDMKRRDDATWIYTKNYEPATYIVKETPEEILAMPDIETKDKVIDWEQRRYEIANNVIGRILSVPYFLSAAKDNPIESLVSVSVRIADALINELKKGQDNEN